MPKRPRDTLGSSATSEDILPNAESVIEIAVNSRPQVWWRGALVNVVPDNFLRWHRKGFRLLWRWGSRSVGRPRIPKNLPILIHEMAAENPTWGEQRIANELKLELAIPLSRAGSASTATLLCARRTRNTLVDLRPQSFQRDRGLRLLLGDHRRFRTLYVFVVIEIGSRQKLHQNVTAHPTAEWTLPQFREALPGGHPYRFVIHDCDRIFADEVDQALANLGVRVLPTPVRAPQASSVCERLGGSLRRECLNFLIPFNQRHLQMILRRVNHAL